MIACSLRQKAIKLRKQATVIEAAVTQGDAIAFSISQKAKETHDEECKALEETREEFERLGRVIEKGDRPRSSGRRGSAFSSLSPSPISGHRIMSIAKSRDTLVDRADTGDEE